MKTANYIQNFGLGLLLATAMAFSQTTYSFTNASATGKNGPTQSQINSAYASTNLNNAVTINTQGVQEWTVPASGTYTIEVWGARGGGSGNYGKGARMKGDFSLTQGDVLRIVVGQMGGASSSGSGGGGTFVIKNTSTILVIAGGGGGGSIRNSSYPNGKVGSATTTASDGSDDNSLNDQPAGTGGAGGSGVVIIKEPFSGGSSCWDLRTVFKKAVANDWI